MIGIEEEKKICFFISLHRSTFLSAEIITERYLEYGSLIDANCFRDLVIGSRKYFSFSLRGAMLNERKRQINF